MDGSDQNPMLNLFYGHFLSEGHNEGTTLYLVNALLIFIIVIFY